MYFYIFVIYIFSIFLHCKSDLITRRNLFDEDLYNDVLDSELCSKQLQYLQESGNGLQFLDAGVRVPRSISKWNLADWGNYHQCLGIQQEMKDGSLEQSSSLIEGKYCSVQVPLQQDIPNLPTTLSMQLNLSELLLYEQGFQDDFMKYQNIKRDLNIMLGLGMPRVEGESTFAHTSLSLGICIPKVCSTNETLNFLFDGQNVVHTESYCRLPGDKPFLAADYGSIALFSIIGLLIILSTSYDLYCTLVLKQGPKEVNTLRSSFSVYTNTRRLLSFQSSPDALHCIDGIRAISMLWVVIGHKFSGAQFISENISDGYDWIVGFQSFWIVSAPIVVDTFLMMTGLLLVYTTVGKISKGKFIKNLHLFYLLRYLRMFPLLAATVLLQTSILHHISDGPRWQTVARFANNCHNNWWHTLLYVQNYLSPTTTCLVTTWYLAVDMQLYWISPLVLVWLLGGRRRVAWVALSAGLLASLLGGSIYSYLNNFPTTRRGTAQRDDYSEFYKFYYVNTLTRASPFFVGMVFGYILNIYRGRKVKMSRVLVFLFWAVSIAVTSFAVFIIHPLTKPDYDNQSLDNFLNSFMRPLWATAIGWCIFACTHGFGGPVNWFLCLRMWKLPARLSFAMYLLHFSIIYVIQCSMVRPIYFTTAGVIYNFLSDLVITAIASFILMLAFDSPASTLQKLIMGEGLKSRVPPPKGIAPAKLYDAEANNLSNNNMSKNN